MLTKTKKISKGLKALKCVLEALFPDSDHRSQITANDFLYLNHLSLSDPTWFQNDSEDILATVFKDKFLVYRKSAKVTESQFKERIEAAQAILKGPACGPGMTMQYPQGMAGFSDVHNNNFLVSCDASQLAFELILLEHELYLYGSGCMGGPMGLF